MNIIKKDKKDLNKLDILKIIFHKILLDKKIDDSEKILFLDFKREFDISDNIYSKILSETLETLKNEGNIFSSEFENINVDDEKYKASIYQQVYYEMLLNGEITKEENELLIKLSNVLKLPEHIENEAVISAQQKIIEDAKKQILNNNYNDAKLLLLSFIADNKLLDKYYKTVYELIKAIYLDKETNEILTMDATLEYEKNFLYRNKNLLTNLPCWEAYYYYALLIPFKNNELREETFKKVLEVADNDYKKHLTYFQLAYGMQKIKKFQKALEYYYEADKYLPLDVHTSTNILSCMLSLNMDLRAKSFVLDKIDKILPNSLWLNNCGIVFVKSKNYKKALEMFQKALELDPNFNDAKINISKIEKLLNFSQKK